MPGPSSLIEGEVSLCPVVHLESLNAFKPVQGIASLADPNSSEVIEQKATSWYGDGDHSEGLLTASPKDTGGYVILGIALKGGGGGEGEKGREREEGDKVMDKYQKERTGGGGRWQYQGEGGEVAISGGGGEVAIWQIVNTLIIPMRTTLTKWWKF